MIFCFVREFLSDVAALLVFVVLPQSDRNIDYRLTFTTKEIDHRIKTRSQTTTLGKPKHYWRDDEKSDKKHFHFEKDDSQMSSKSFRQKGFDTNTLVSW